MGKGVGWQTVQIAPGDKGNTHGSSEAKSAHGEDRPQGRSAAKSTPTIRTHKNVAHSRELTRLERAKLFPAEALVGPLQAGQLQRPSNRLSRAADVEVDNREVRRHDS